MQKTFFLLASAFQEDVSFLIGHCLFEIPSENIELAQKVGAVQGAVRPEHDRELPFHFVHTCVDDTHLILW